MVPRLAAVVLAALALAACLLCLIGIAWADDEPLVTVSASQWTGRPAQGRAAADGESLDEGASDIVDGTATSASPKDVENLGGSDRGMVDSGGLSIRGQNTTPMPSSSISLTGMHLRLAILSMTKRRLNVLPGRHANCRLTLTEMECRSRWSRWMEHMMRGCR